MVWGISIGSGGCIMTIVQIARQHWIAVIKLHRGQYVYQVPCMFYLYLYLYISLFLSLSISISKSLSVSILNFPCVYSSTYTSIRVPTGNVQQKDCLPPITTLCRRRFQGERTWPGTSASTWRATTTGCSKLSIDQVGSLEIIGFDLCYCLQGPFRERYTPWKIDNSWFETCKWWWILWFRWRIFSGFHKFLLIFLASRSFSREVPLQNGRRVCPFFTNPPFGKVAKIIIFPPVSFEKQRWEKWDHYICHHLFIAGLS